MQRLAFPRTHEDRRGTRIKYTFEEMVLIVLAFRIMETGVASPHAYDLIARSKAEIAVAFEQAWPRKALPGKTDIFLSYRPHVLSTELGRSALMSASAIGSPLEPVQSIRPSRKGTVTGDLLQVIINISDVANRLRSTLKVLGRATTELQELLYFGK